MVLYLSIQLRCPNKNKPKCLSNVRHTKNGNYFIFIFFSWRVIEPYVHTTFSITIRKLLNKRWHILR